MSSVIIAGDTSGTVTLAAPAVAGTNTLTLPANTGTVLTSATTQAGLPSNIAGNGPTFRTYPSASQSLSVNVFTKIQFNTTVFDTASNFNTSTYRFTPTVAGYYQVTTGTSAQSTSATNAILTVIYKNGAVYDYGNAVPCSAYSYGYSQVTALVYCNGSTDYIETYAQITGATGSIVCNGIYFQGYLARSA